MLNDVTEVITGDMPTPVKYYNVEMQNVYKDIESVAGERLLSMLPDEFREDYAPFFNKEKEDARLWEIVKAADRIDALIKCIEECRMGNKEFEKAMERQQKIVDEIDMDEVRYFAKKFLPAYSLTLDEHTK